MNDAQIDKLLKLAQLIELHGKMGGTKPFDRLLAPVARELNALTDELHDEEMATQKAEKEEAEAKAQAKRDEAQRQMDLEGKPVEQRNDHNDKAERARREFETDRRI